MCGMNVNRTPIVLTQYIFVDSNTSVVDNVFNVITSRLRVANRSIIHNGDKIECIAYDNALPTNADYLTIIYTGKLKNSSES